MNPTSLDHADILTSIDYLIRQAHGAARAGGWWTNLATGEPLDRNNGEMLMLMVSEVIEARSGYIGVLMDDKLPHRKMVEVELADFLIRCFDFAGGRNLRLAEAVTLIDEAEGWVAQSTMCDDDPQISMFEIVHHISNAMEGDRKNRDSQEYPGFKVIEVELAAAVRRTVALGYGLVLDVRGALDEKMAYNRTREDHQIANRMKADGKRY